MKNEQINFKIVNGDEISEKLKNKIIKEYNETDKTKTDVANFINKKYGLSYRTCYKVLREVSNKPRSLYKMSYPAFEIIKSHGGLKLVQALLDEGWSVNQVANYMEVKLKAIYDFLKKESLVLPEKKSVLTDEDVEFVKKKYGIK